MHRFTLSLLATSMMAGVALAQCNPQPPVLTTTVAGNSQKGTMFDIVNTSAASIAITGFDQVFSTTGSADVEVYTKAGTWNGFENTAAAWTLAGSATAVAHQGPPNLTPLPIALNVAIAAGATQAFYITATAATATNVSYTTGVAGIGAVIGTDGLIQVLGGPGKTYPFGSSFGLPTQGRLWNGQVHYCVNGDPATNTSLGLGCIRVFASFYDFFATPAQFDLNNSAITMTPSGGGYTVTSGGSFLPVGSVQTPALPLVLADDGEFTVPFVTGSFSGPTGAWSGVTVISNGKVAQAAGNSTLAAPSITTMLAEPQTAFYTQADFDPSVATGAGTVWVEQNATVTSVTWDAVASWNVPGSSNTFQIQLYANGNVVMAWQSMATGGANGGLLVGYSPGGPNLDPLNSDLSALGSISLAGADGPPAMSVVATSRPVTGTTWSLQVNDIPAGAALGVEVLGLTDPGIDDLTVIGMPGCGLRAALDVLTTFVPAGSTHTYGLAVPANPALIGFEVFTTDGMFVNPPPNAFGAVSANGVRGVVVDA